MTTDVILTFLSTLVLVLSGLLVFFSLRYDKLLRQAKEELEEVSAHNKRLSARVIEAKADHAAELHRIAKSELNVEQLALAFEDIGREGEMVLRIQRLDPNSMYTWRDRKTLEEDIKL